MFLVSLFTEFFKVKNLKNALNKELLLKNNNFNYPPASQHFLRGCSKSQSAVARRFPPSAEALEASGRVDAPSKK